MRAHTRTNFSLTLTLSHMHQQDSESVDAATVITQIWQKGGPKGFFAGLGSRLPYTLHRKPYILNPTPYTITT